MTASNLASLDAVEAWAVLSPTEPSLAGRDGCLQSPILKEKVKDGCQLQATLEGTLEGGKTLATREALQLQGGSCNLDLSGLNMTADGAGTCQRSAKMTKEAGKESTLASAR